jgi:hypothetical protein
MVSLAEGFAFRLGGFDDYFDKLTELTTADGRIHTT